MLFFDIPKFLTKKFYLLSCARGVLSIRKSVFSTQIPGRGARPYISLQGISSKIYTVGLRR